MKERIPLHVAIIMDGNGRWANLKGLPRVAGHQAGVQTVKEVVKAAADLGISILTLYAFSQENWKRPEKEVRFLMSLLDSFIDKEIDTLVKEGVKLQTIGHIEALPSGTVAKIKKAVERTSGNSKLLLNLALNYGSRTEILDAVTRIVQDAKGKAISNGSHPLTEEEFSQYLYTRGLPDPDLLIRTSGEMRLSNFLLWQLSYAEIYITKKYWPDFGKEDLKKAIEEFSKRDRRYGDIE